MPGLGIFEHDSFGIEYLSGYDKDKVKIAEVEYLAVFFYGPFGSNDPAAGRDRHAKVFFKIIVDRVCRDFRGQTLCLGAHEVIGVKNNSFSSEYPYTLDIIQYFTDIESGPEADRFVSFDFFKDKDSGFGTNPVASGCFREAFDSADRKQGEEIGMTNAYFKDISEYADVESTNIYDVLLKQGKTKEEVLHILQVRSRDNARTPMQWDDSPNGGFSDVTPWLHSTFNYPEINVQKEKEAPDSIFAFYQELIRMRKTMDIVQNGKVVPVLEDHPAVFAYKRVTEDETLVCVNNFFEEETDVEICLEGYEYLLGNYPAPAFGKTLHLRPYETVIALKKNQQ